MRFARFSLFVLVFTLAVVVWGALVRATGSGAGCGAHWPLCNGEVVPQSPSVATLIEYGHRATSGIEMLLVFAQLAWAWRAFRVPGHRVRRAAIASAVFVTTEALIGAGIVLLELVAGNDSVPRAAWISLHLVNTFLLVGSVALTALWSRDEAHEKLDPGAGLGWILGIAAVALVLTGIAGAVTALGDTLFPARSLAEGLAADQSSGAHFLVRLRVIHPVVATLSFVYVVMASGLVAMLRPEPRVRRAAIALALSMVVQMIAGLVNLGLLAPLGMQLVHLLLADIAWIALVVLGATALAARRARAPESEGGAVVARA